MSYWFRMFQPRGEDAYKMWVSCTLMFPFGSIDHECWERNSHSALFVPLFTFLSIKRSCSHVSINSIDSLMCEWCEVCLYESDVCRQDARAIQLWMCRISNSLITLFLIPISGMKLPEWDDAGILIRHMKGSAMIVSCLCESDVCLLDASTMQLWTCRS